MKRTQLDIEIDEELLKALKYLAISKNIKLNKLVKEILSEKIKLQGAAKIKSGFSEKDSKNCTNFMKSLFEKTVVKFKYQSKDEAFKSLITFIEIYDQWDNSDTLRLKSVLLESGEAWNSDELNRLTRDRDCECPIYAGLKTWTGSYEFPSQQLICDLGSSLVPIIENSIKPKKIKR